MAHTECCLFDHCAGSNATSLVYWLSNYSLLVASPYFVELFTGSFLWPNIHFWQFYETT